MPDTRDNLLPPDDERLLDRAVEALRDAPVPDGPSPELEAKTRAAVRAAQARQLRAGRFGSFGAPVRIAAAVALVATLAGVYLATRRAPVTLVTPTSRPSPQDAPLVQNDAVPNPVPAAPVVVRREPKSPVGAKVAVVPDRGMAHLDARLDAIIGTVSFVGVAPPRAKIDMSAVAECRLHHPEGGLDDRLIVTGGRVANVVVSVEPPPGQDLAALAPAEDAPRDPVVLDQHDCRFVPHVLAGMVGQELVVKNSDPFLHNVHSRAKVNDKFNIGQPNVDPGRSIDSLEAAERFDIRCDIHPWMNAVVNVFEHPYFAVSAEDGSFTMSSKGLPDGEYTLLAWHETLGERRTRIRLQDGEATTPVEFRFDPQTAAAPAAAAKPADPATTAKPAATAATVKPAEPVGTGTVQVCASCDK